MVKRNDLFARRQEMAKIPDKVIVERSVSGDLYMTFTGESETYTFGINSKAATELLDAMHKAVVVGELEH